MLLFLYFFNFCKIFGSLWSCRLYFFAIFIDIKRVWLVVVVVAAAGSWEKKCCPPRPFLVEIQIFTRLKKWFVSLSLSLLPPRVLIRNNSSHTQTNTQFKHLPCYHPLSPPTPLFDHQSLLCLSVSLSLWLLISSCRRAVAVPIKEREREKFKFKQKTKQKTKCYVKKKNKIKKQNQKSNEPRRRRRTTMRSD